MSLETPKILIVDDEPLSLELIVDRLENDNQGYELVTVGNGDDARNMLESSPEDFDVVLLDRIMPGLDGIEVLARIKAHPVLKVLPVILQTGRTEEKDILEGIQAGAYYYLTKPFDKGTLNAVVNTAVKDRMVYLGLQQDLEKTHNSLGLLERCSFRFRTLDDARGLALLLARACPEPDRVLVGLSELLINAVEHGNLGISYDDKTRLNMNGDWEQEVGRRLASDEYRDRFGRLEFSRNDDSIDIVIRDMGEGFAWNSYLTMTPERGSDNHGRGIAMAGMISFDNIEYRGKGNEVVASILLH